jgi:hypothetical protein
MTDDQPRKDANDRDRDPGGDREQPGDDPGADIDDRDDTSRLDPESPGRSLIDDDSEIVEPNEPA